LVGFGENKDESFHSYIHHVLPISFVLIFV
jgi:hypothetical protein